MAKPPTEAINRRFRIARNTVRSDKKRRPKPRNAGSEKPRPEGNSSKTAAPNHENDSSEKQKAAAHSNRTAGRSLQNDGSEKQRPENKIKII